MVQVSDRFVRYKDNRQKDGLNDLCPFERWRLRNTSPCSAQPAAKDPPRDVGSQPGGQQHPKHTVDVTPREKERETQRKRTSSSLKSSPSPLRKTERSLAGTSGVKEGKRIKDEGREGHGVSFGLTSSNSSTTRTRNNTPISFPYSQLNGRDPLLPSDEHVSGHGKGKPGGGRKGFFVRTGKKYQKTRNTHRTL